MNQYQYKILEDKVFRKSVVTEEELNRLGKQGWELVKVDASEGVKKGYFKREL